MFKEGWMGVTYVPFRGMGRTLKRYPTVWERKSVKEFERGEATYAYLAASGLDLETISHRKYYVQVVNNGVCRGLSYYGFILRPQ